MRLITSNWLALLVNVIAHFALGMAWYGAFAAQWLEGIAARERGFDPQAAPPVIYLTSVIAVALSTLVVARLVESSGDRSIMSGVKWALILGAAIAVPTLLMHYSFAGHGIGLTLIDGGYQLASLVLTGIVVGALGFRGTSVSRPAMAASAA